MKIYTVWAVRKSSPDEPELVTAWDEYSVDAYPEGYDEDVKKGLESWGDDLLTHREIILRASYPAILQKFQSAEVDAEVES